MTPSSPPKVAPWRDRVHEIIFEADTPAGKLFDVALLVMILMSVLLVMLDSVASIHDAYAKQLYIAEWVFTIAFTIEYVLRLICVRHPIRYATSFFGVVDLLAILPTYLNLFLAGTPALLVIRALRLLRIFRVFKLARFLSEADSLRHALWAARAKIIVFVTTVVILVLIMAALMYVVEGGRQFDSIPSAMYWGVVTITTVGYGDITPETVLGKIIAATMMIMGYSLIIVPTGILSAELVQKAARPVTTRSCPTCTRDGHDIDASHCKHCGAEL